MNVGLLLSFLYLVVPSLIAAVLLYWIIRMGVKHGMRSHYADAAHRIVPADGIIGAEATDPIAVYPEDLSDRNK